MPRGDALHPAERANDAEWETRNGGVRCHRIRHDGKRCRRWAVRGYKWCHCHGAPKRERRRMPYKFKTKRVRDLFEEAVSNPEYQSIRSELALIRTCVQLFVDHAEEHAEKGTLKPKHVAFMAQMASDAAKVAEQCNRIERGLSLHVSVEAMDAFLGQLIGTIIRVVKDDDLVQELSDAITSMEMPTGTTSHRMREAREAADAPDADTMRDKAASLGDDDEENE